MKNPAGMDRQGSSGLCCNNIREAPHLSIGPVQQRQAQVLIIFISLQSKSMPGTFTSFLTNNSYLWTGIVCKGLWKPGKWMAGDS